MKLTYGKSPLAKQYSVYKWDALAEDLPGSDCHPANECGNRFEIATLQT